jgi:hypothetical protein
MKEQIENLTKRLVVEINKTPSGDLRNLLTDAHVLIQALNIHGVVFNEADLVSSDSINDAPEPLWKIYDLDVEESEVELFCRVCKGNNIKHYPEEYYECLGCGHEFTK